MTASQQCLEHILRIIVNVYEAHTSVLFLRQEDQRYRLSAAFSLGDKVDEGVVITPGTGLAGWIIREEKPLVINNFDRAKGVLGYYRTREETSIRAFMGCPLEGGRGVLCLDSKHTYAFSAKDQKILAQFAALTSSLGQDDGALEAPAVMQGHYRALSALPLLRRESTRWPDYLENYLRLVSSACGMEHAFLTVRAEDGESYALEGSTSQSTLRGPRSVAIGSGLAGWVFKNGQMLVRGRGEGGPAGPLFGPEVTTPTAASVVCTPLVFRRKVRAVLVLASEQQRVIDDELKGFLSAAAAGLELFLENLYLRNRLTVRRTGG